MGKKKVCRKRRRWYSMRENERKAERLIAALDKICKISYYDWANRRQLNNVSWRYVYDDSTYGSGLECGGFHALLWKITSDGYDYLAYGAGWFTPPNYPQVYRALIRAMTRERIDCDFSKTEYLRDMLAGKRYAPPPPFND